MISIVAYQDRYARLRRIFDRSGTLDVDVESAVQRILQKVRDAGDQALAEFTETFDGVRPASLRVDPAAVEAAFDGLSADLLSILEAASENIRRFHERQRRETWFVDDGDGVVLGQRFVPIDRTGLYVPGGKAVYPSSVLMNVIPAQVAGVREIHLASPPGPDGLPHPLVLAASRLLGIENIYAVGGAQAIGAFAYGTETIPAVDKIVGPGNAYVVAAKKMVYGRVDIDSFAGPSEIVVLADESADAEYVAADLLSQAEHDQQASAVLVTTSESLAEEVRRQIEMLVPTLSRRRIIEASLRDYGACIVTSSLEEAVDVVNELAPEHLELLVENPWETMPGIRHAGAIFMGPYSPEPVGDYFAGPNHVLPTSGTARFSSALGVDDFVRRQSVIAYSRERLMRTGRGIASFAMAEQFDAHALAIEVRTKRYVDST
jgi:histidinol dehydrogenase